MTYFWSKFIKQISDLFSFYLMEWNVYFILIKIKVILIIYMDDVVIHPYQLSIEINFNSCTHKFHLIIYLNWKYWKVRCRRWWWTKFSMPTETTLNQSQPPTVRCSLPSGWRVLKFPFINIRPMHPAQCKCCRDMGHAETWDDKV